MIFSRMVRESFTNRVTFYRDLKEMGAEGHETLRCLGKAVPGRSHCSCGTNLVSASGGHVIGTE